MLARSLAMVFKAVESDSRPVSGIKKLAMIYLLLKKLLWQRALESSRKTDGCWFYRSAAAESVTVERVPYTLRRRAGYRNTEIARGRSGAGRSARMRRREGRGSRGLRLCEGLRRNARGGGAACARRGA